MILITLLQPVPHAFGFTQSVAGTEISNGIPMGHEWLTRLAALELLGGDPIMGPDPNDPRMNRTSGKAKNLSLERAAAVVKAIKSQSYRDRRYQATYKNVYDSR